MITATGVIVPSAGRGSRMGTGQAKQLQPINGTAILAHTVCRLLALDSVRYLIVPTSTDLYQVTRNILSQCLKETEKSDTVKIEVIAGGAERMDSVRNGLVNLMNTDAELVLVHDAVRPCFPLEAVEKAVDVAMSRGAACLGVPASDTIKLVDEDHRVISTPVRKRVWHAQTPQIFHKHILFEAYKKAEESGFSATDDASLVEYAGYPVHMVEGNRQNIKITYPSDLFFAEKWIQENTRT